MNKYRRDKLKKITEALDNLSLELTDISYDESCCLNNMPYNLLESKRCVSMEDAVDEINSAVYSINDAITSINTAIG